MKIAKIIFAVVAILAITAIGFCTVEVALLARQMQASTAAMEKTAVSVLARVDATVTDLDRTVQIAGGAINEARRIERDNRQQIAGVNRETLRTLQHVDELIQSVDVSQKQAVASIGQTSAALVPVMQQTEKDLAELQPAIQQITPLIQRTTDIAVNLSNTTADVAHEVHKLVYPPPRKWYQKYFLDPLRTVREMFKFTHPV